MPQRHTDSTYNELMDSSYPDAELNLPSTCKGNWTLALISALLKPQLHFSDWTKENWTLETQECNSMEIKLSTIPHPPMRVSENAFSQDIVRIPHPAVVGEGKALTPPLALLDIVFTKIVALNTNKYMSQLALSWLQILLSNAHLLHIKAFCSPLLFLFYH